MPERSRPRAVSPLTRRRSSMSDLLFEIGCEEIPAKMLAKQLVDLPAPDGTLTKAGQGFAAKNGVEPSALSKREVPGKKGLYVVATRDVTGHDARALLPQLLAELAAAIPWPKSQRWGWSETTFVRPVQW